MKQKFREIKLSAENKKRLEMINEIIEEYQEEGYTLTLRQLYYQLVSRDVVPNQTAEYAKLSKLLKEGRMSGIVDWSAIEDRLRQPKSPASFNSPKDIIKAAINQYALPRQQNQPVHLEVWVEKDALSGVLYRVTSKYHVPIMVNRGYSSVSAMYDAYKRFEDAIEADQIVRILYLGDFDPSGMDMIRDVRDRIKEFLVNSEDLQSTFEDTDEFYDLHQKWFEEIGYDGTDRDRETTDLAAKALAMEEWIDSKFTVEPIALTREQITMYNPPENPAKKTDPRSKGFIGEYGSSSYEVDALKPEILNELLTDSIEEHIDVEMYQEVVNSEAADKSKLREILTQF